MRTLLKIFLWIVTVTGALMTAGGFAVTFDGSNNIAAGIFLIVIFISITVSAASGLYVMARKDRAAGRTVRQQSPVADSTAPQEPTLQNDTSAPAFAPASRSQHLLAKKTYRHIGLLFSADGRRQLREHEAQLITNAYTRVGAQLFALFAVAWLFFMVAPIVITLVEVRGAVSQDRSNYGPGGMVVFSLFFLTPLWGAVVAAWFAIPSFVCLVIGAMKANWKLHTREYILLGVTFLLISIAIITALTGSDIYGFYQRWFLPWTV